MPPIRRQANFRQLSDFERGRIVGMKEAGLSLREIGRRIGRNPVTIMRCWQSWSQEGRQHRRRGSGRPRKSNQRQDRLLRLMAVRDRFQTSASVWADWRRAVGPTLSLRSVYRRIRSFGLFSFRPYRRLPLTTIHPISGTQI